MEIMMTDNSMPRDADEKLREEDMQQSEEISEDMQDTETDEEDLDESDLEENDLTEEESDDIEWEVPGDTNSESASRS